MKECYMILIKYTNQFDFEYDIQGMIRSFFPGVEMHTQKAGEETNTLKSDRKAHETETGSKIFIPEYDRGITKPKLVLECSFQEKEMELLLNADEQCMAHVSFEKVYNSSGYDRKETKNKLKRKLYDIFHDYTGRELPWGTLSGIRPTKITSALLESGMSAEDVRNHMRDIYYLSDGKIEESIKISETELKILQHIDYKTGYSLYIGIPFCPSTCLYCSFTSNPISRFADKIDKYLDALFKEIDFCAEVFKDRRLCTIYIGGGTPTTLTENQLDRLLSKISTVFNTKDLYEFTIEAGRPDSITREKLKIIKKYNITRISINPQTMKDETLKIIGRHHTVRQFIDAFRMAREENFDNINMDFILGLPGENMEDVRYSMEWVEKLKPDSLTIHSLAVKRAARLNLEKSVANQMYKGYKINNSEEIMQITKNTAKKLGLHPYYLYRQKNMAGNLENTGYAKETKEGIYNILIMEEKQTILAVGAGSSSKMVLPDSNKIGRVENIKDVDLYMDKIDEMIDRKQQYISEHFE